MEEYESEDWIALYRAALIELEHAKMTGRVEAARTAIVARLEKLQTLPGLHPQERQAIEDALSGLKSLEREEARFKAEEERRATVEEALEKLRAVGPTIQRLRKRQNDPE
jgi:hypothetical protein